MHRGFIILTMYILFYAKSYPSPRRYTGMPELRKDIAAHYDLTVTLNCA